MAETSLPLSAAEFRRLAWKRLSRPAGGGGYGLYFLALLLQGVAAAVAVVLLLMLFGVSCMGIYAIVMGQSEATITPASFAVSLLASAVLVLGVLYVCGFCSWGQRAMSIALVRGGLTLSHAFSGMGNGWRMVSLILWQQTFIFFWTLLFIIPGIRAAFSYAMAPYLLIDHPDWKPLKCLAESKRLMAGNRWRFFCLNFSFIGWWLLVVLVAQIPIIGFFSSFLLTPYVDTACALFYEDLLDRRASDAENEAPPMPAGDRTDYT